MVGNFKQWVSAHVIIYAEIKNRRLIEFLTLEMEVLIFFDLPHITYNGLISNYVFLKYATVVVTSLLCVKVQQTRLCGFIFEYKANRNIRQAFTIDVRLVIPEQSVCHLRTRAP